MLRCHNILWYSTDTCPSRLVRPCLSLPNTPHSQIVYARLLRLLYKLQVQMWRLIRKHDPRPYEESVLGFLEPRLRMLSRVSLLKRSDTWPIFRSDAGAAAAVSVVAIATYGLTAFMSDSSVTS